MLADGGGAMVVLIVVMVVVVVVVVVVEDYGGVGGGGGTEVVVVVVVLMNIMSYSITENTFPSFIRLKYFPPNCNYLGVNWKIFFIICFTLKNGGKHLPNKYFQQNRV